MTAYEDTSKNNDYYITAGTTLFFVMSYILVANPLILSCGEGAPSGCTPMPAGPVLLGTCLTAGLFSIISGFLTKTPSVLAPGMAFNIYFIQFISQNHVHWSVGLILCGISGFLVLLLTLSGGRYQIITSVPPALARSIGGGIGALLAETAVRYIHKPHSEDFDPHLLFLFFVGLLIICPLYFYGRNFARRSSLSPVMKRVIDTIGCASFTLSIIVIWYFGPRQDFHQSSVSFLWAQMPSAAEIKTIKDPASMSFIVFLVYMLTIDIVGSPYDMIRHNVIVADKADQRRLEDRGFKIDSIANIFAPMFGTSPVVFFAESHAARLVGARSGRAAIVAGLLFLLIGIVVFLLSLRGITFAVPPTIAIAPTLFVVGAVVVAESLYDERGTPRQEVGSFFEDPAKLLDSLPAAITVIVTPLADIQFGLAGGIVAFFMLACLLPEERRVKEINQRPWFVGLALFAALAIVFMSWVYLQHSW